MNPTELLESVYLGDRACKSILVDGWNAEVKIQVTCISRVRGKSWDFYTNEDLIDGFLVFEGVKSIAFEPPGIIPNDTINDVCVEGQDIGTGAYIFDISIDAVDLVGGRTEVKIRIIADSLALEDQTKLGSRIRN